MMWEIDSVKEALANFGLAIAAAIAGRVARHAQLVQKGLRRFWGLQLALELPVAIFMGFVGNGLAEWLELGPRASTGIVAALSYLGPAAIERVFAASAKNF
ncbi:MAG: phage holin family protein [Dongiaceae bacterium]